MAVHSWGVVEAILGTLRRLLENPVWQDRLIDGTTDEAVAVVRLVDAIPVIDRARLTDALGTWADGPAPVAMLARRLALRAAFGTSTPPPDLPAGHAYSLITIDGSDPDPQANRHRAEVAAAVARRLGERSAGRLVTVIHYMGLGRPIAGPGETVAVERLIPPDLGRRPRLVVPIIERYPAGSVRLVLALSNEAPLDQADWRGRVYAYGERGRPWDKPVVAILARSSVAGAEEEIVRRVAQDAPEIRGVEVRT